MPTATHGTRHARVDASGAASSRPCPSTPGTGLAADGLPARMPDVSTPSPTVHALAGYVAAAAALTELLAHEAAEVDHDGGFPAASIAALHARGLLGGVFAEAGDGLGAPEATTALLHVLAHLGRGSLPVGRLYEGHLNALMLIGAHGTAAQRARAAAEARSGALFAVWNTEGAEGVRLAPAGSGRWRLAGAKTFASGAGHVRHALVTARTPDGGWQLAWLDTGRHPPALDARFWQPLGMKASASYKVDVTGAVLDADALLGEPDAYYREPAFSGGAIRFAAVQVGGIEAVFDATRAQLRRERRTDDPHQQARLGAMAADVTMARHWLNAAGALAARDTGNTSDAARIAHANLMRSAIDAIGQRTLQQAERSVGARGLLKPAPFERLHRDLTHYLRQANPDAVLAAAGAHVLAREDAACALWGDDTAGAR